MEQPPPLEALLRWLLPQLDDELSKAGIPISGRPLKAACIVVDHYVVDIKGDTKEGYLNKKWFASIYIPVREWFIARYGPAQVHPPQVSQHGVVKHHGAFYLLRIPLTVARPPQDDTFGLVFAREVLPEEDPASWLINGPSLEVMHLRSADTLRRAATCIANQVRGIVNNISTAKLPDEATRAMLDSVMCHLDKAAVGMCDQSNGASSLATWELLSACEKIIKVYLVQENIPIPRIHDLLELNRQAFVKHGSLLTESVLGRCPSSSRVLKWRYQAIKPPTMSELWKFYEAALQLCTIYSSWIKRDIYFDNFSIQLGKPPWVLI